MKDECTKTNIIRCNWTYFTLVAAELSPQRTGFNLMAVHVGFVVGEVGRRNIFPRFHHWSMFINWRITDATEGVEHKVCRTSRWYYAIHFGYKMLHQYISDYQALYLPVSILVFQNCARYCTIASNHGVCRPHEGKLLYYYKDGKFCFETSVIMGRERQGHFEKYSV
jgi:hypothetical protein